MLKFKKTKIAGLVALSFFIGACAPYLIQSRSAIDAYYRGDFQRAVEYINDVHPRKADRMVSYLDKGTIFHTVKKYNKSIKYFSKAIDLYEGQLKQALLPQVGAVFTNDNALPYVADPYERLMIHTYQVMNYAALGDFENAQVEVRRINTVFPEIYSDREKRSYLKNAFTAYLSALIWEMNGNCNDAYIDYKRVGKLWSKLPGLNADIERSGKCSGLITDLKGHLPLPNLIIVIENGRSPVKISTEYDASFQIIPVPIYEDRPTSIRKVRISIDSNRIGYTEKLEDVGEALEHALDEEMTAIVARALARLAIKEGIAIAVGEEVDETLGAVIGTMMLATNRADLRSWQTLPDTLQIWRGTVPEGKRTILLEFLDDRGKRVHSISRTVDIEKNRGRLVVFRSVD